ncbi:MAG: hypothetical protein JXB85_07095 [Anaerolineales bacterium]|nr:hypothetical protein [Anaerolineales bacterium]
MIPTKKTSWIVVCRVHSADPFADEGGLAEADRRRGECDLAARLQACVQVLDQVWTFAPPGGEERVV